jgi:hypothetical protein
MHHARRRSHFITIVHRNRGPSNEAKRFCKRMNALIGMFNSMLQVRNMVLMAMVVRAGKTTGRVRNGATTARSVE